MERFTNPTEAQQASFQWLNIALGALATAYGVPEDELNERAGSAVENIIDELADGGGSS